MHYVYEDFVNREEQIALLHKAVSGLAWRVVLITGRKGIGKTSLLSEFQAEAASFDLNLAQVDLARRLSEQGYWSVILQVAGQLGWETFANLARAQQDAGRFLPARPGEAQAPPGAQAAVLQAVSGGRSGGIDFSASVHAPGAVFAGRDVNYLIQYGDPKEQSSVRAMLTGAFKADLLASGQRRRLVLMLDHWEAANDETRLWLTDHLARWFLLERSLPAVLVVASADPPDWYQRRQDIAPLEMGKLPDAAVREYWRKQGLPPERLGEPVSLYGLPELLVLFAKEVSLELKGLPG